MRYVILLVLALTLFACDTAGPPGNPGAGGNQGSTGARGGPGADGAPGVSIAFGTGEATEQQCPYGGTVLYVWLDVKANGAYDEGVDTNLTQIPVCHGAPGHSHKHHEDEHGRDH